MSMLWDAKGYALCRLVECIALCQTPLSAADQAALLAVVDENLCHPAASIQDAAAAALHAVARSYLLGASSSSATQCKESRILSHNSPLRSCTSLESVRAFCKSENARG